MVIDDIFSHPVGIALGRIIQFLIAVGTVMTGLIVGSFVGFISVCGVIATISKAPDINVFNGAMWFTGVIVGAFFVGFSLLGLARLAYRVLVDADTATLFNLLKAKS